MLVRTGGYDWPLMADSQIVGLALEEDDTGCFVHMEDGSIWDILDDISRWPLLDKLVNFLADMHAFSSMTCETWPEYLNDQLTHAKVPKLTQVSSNHLLGYFVFPSRALSSVLTDQVLTDTTVSTWIHFGDSESVLLGYANNAPRTTRDLDDAQTLLLAPEPCVWIMNTNKESKVKLTLKVNPAVMRGIGESLEQHFRVRDIAMSWNEWRG